MITKTNNRIMDKLVHFLRYDTNKALNMYIGVLLVVPALFFIYLEFALNMASMGLRTYFDKSPITAVMFIVCLVDLIVAYTLYFKKDVLLNSKKNIVVVFTTLTLVQLAVGNLISLVLGIIILYLSKDIDSNNKKMDKNFIYLLIGCTPIYAISTLILINMGIH